MPTGYTSKIYDNQDLSLETYIKDCARGMGMFGHMRDENRDVPLHYPSYSPFSNIYLDNLLEAKIEARSIASRSEEEWYGLWSTYYENAVSNAAKVSRERAELRARYQYVKNQVLKMKVPSKMESFKNFMIDQLESSIAFDCADLSSYDTPIEYVRWVSEQKSKNEWNLEYYSSQLAKSNERIEEIYEYIGLFSETFGIEVKLHDKLDS